ncbi:hypothetical protein ACQ856_28740 (plasmid) [Mycolicibacterium psychrotolerans]|uniref:hypothetical protein n=1 Tax=Mycolicibacterium psychrotolerans TaxID=216929 RepID=UPI003D66EFB4
MPAYLIVDDNSEKVRNYRKFERHYADQGIEFRIAASPKAAVTALQANDFRAGIDGVVADFELQGLRQDKDLCIDVAGPNGEDYTISTGLGVLDWVHTVEPGLPLWALTSLTATHAPLFMSAASLWLNAKPLSVDRFDGVDTPSANRLLVELLDPGSYVTSNPNWPWIDDAQASLHELLNTPYGGHEAFDWIHALTHLPASMGGFGPNLERQIRQVTRNEKLNVFPHTLAPCMAKWQLRLEEIYQDFAVNRDQEKWPTLDEDDLPRGLNVWAEFNPITNFLAQHSECREFFGSEDVRIALTKWRLRGERP